MILGKNGSMTQITIKLTIQELELLTALAADQLFRREFIDPKLPGYRINFAEIRMAKGLVARLRGFLNPGSERKAVRTVV